MWKMKKNRCYIAGKMRGVYCYNFNSFDSAKTYLEGAGYDVVSPADIDRSHGFDPYEIVWPDDWDWNKVPDGIVLSDVIERDLSALRTCNAIYMLKGWEKSRGAIAEKALAEWYGMEVMYEEPKPNGEKDPNGKDAHEKGAKLDNGKARVDLLFSGFYNALLAVADVATHGARKYTDGGWLEVPDGRRRYTAALGRHLLKENIELNDSDSGLAHDAHLAWNALARLELRLRGR